MPRYHEGQFVRIASLDLEGLQGRHGLTPPDDAAGRVGMVTGITGDELDFDVHVRFYRVNVVWEHDGLTWTLPYEFADYELEPWEPKPLPIPKVEPMTVDRIMAIIEDNIIGGEGFEQTDINYVQTVKALGASNMSMLKLRIDNANSIVLHDVMTDKVFILAVKELNQALVNWEQFGDDD